MDATDLPDDLRGAPVAAVDDSPAAREALRATLGCTSGQLVRHAHRPVTAARHGGTAP